MNDKIYTIEVDHLAVALTRPPMFMGVNMRLFFANVVICTLICVDAHTFLGMPLFVVLHSISYKLSIKEPDFLMLGWKALTKTPPVLNSGFWGKTNSYSPW